MRILSFAFPFSVVIQKSTAETKHIETFRAKVDMSFHKDPVKRDPLQKDDN